jgi:hypothetical protein
VAALPHGEPLPDVMAGLGISGRSAGVARMFMTHPPLKERGLIPVSGPPHAWATGKSV